MAGSNISNQCKLLFCKQRRDIAQLAMILRQFDVGFHEQNQFRRQSISDQPSAISKQLSTHSNQLAAS